MIDTSAHAIATNPEWLPRGFDRDAKLLSSVRVPREEYARLTFVNDQYLEDRFQSVVHDRSAIEAAVRDAPGAPLHFIFHSAFCCSTLLAKALDIPGIATVITEPGILTEARFRYENIPGDRDQLLDLVLRLLSRPFGQDRAVVVKPSNFVNPLIGPILGRSPNSRAVLMYSDVRTLLYSVAKYGLSRRVWGRQLYVDLAKTSSLGFPSMGDAIVEKTDLQLAGLAWLMQVHHFRAVAAQLGDQRVMLLDSNRLLDRPGETLASVAAFLDLEVDAEMAGRITAGPAFTTHSKIVGTDYSIERRAADQAQLEQTYGLEVNEAATWLRATAAQLNAQIPERLL